MVTYLLIGWRHYDVTGLRHNTTSGPVPAIPLYWCIWTVYRSLNYTRCTSVFQPLHNFPAYGTGQWELIFDLWWRKFTAGDDPSSAHD